MITAASSFPCLLSLVLLSLGDGGGDDGGVLPRGDDDGVLYVLLLYPLHDDGDGVLYALPLCGGGDVLSALPLFLHDDGGGVLPRDDDDDGVLYVLLLYPRRDGGGVCIDDDRLRSNRQSGSQILDYLCGRQHPQCIPFL